MKDKNRRIAAERMMQLKAWQNLSWYAKLYPSTNPRFHRTMFWNSFEKGTYRKELPTLTRKEQIRKAEWDSLANAKHLH
jgi:hypothetical protein